MIQFFNRSKGTVETEDVYGENWLRLIYEKPLGTLLLWVAVKRVWFSRWYGWRMSRPSSKERIGPFIQQYNLDENGSIAKSGKINQLILNQSIENFKIDSFDKSLDAIIEA